MGRPKTYQPGTRSNWHGLTCRVAVPALAKDRRWTTKVYLLAPDGSSLKKGGVVLHSHKGEDRQDLLKRVEQEIPVMAAEYADVILAAVRAGSWPGMTLDTYVALRRAVIQSCCKWAGKAETYWAHWEQRLCPAVGGVDLLRCNDSAVIEAEIERLTHRKRSKRGYTDTERMDWIILSDILACACRVDGLLEDNPLQAQARKCREKLSTVASRDLARRDLAQDELAALLEICLEHSGEAVYDAMILQVLTGLSASELLALNTVDWQQGSTVTWLEITKAYKQNRSDPPEMTKLLTDANQYRKVVCTHTLEQLLRRLVASHRGTSRSGRGTPLIMTSQGTRLAPKVYKDAVRDTLNEIIRDGAHLSFTSRKSVLSGPGRPTMSHTDILRTTTSYYLRTVCLCNDAERAALLGLHQTHTYAGSYVDWNCELILLYLRNKLDRWHKSILITETDTAHPQQGHPGYHLLVTAQPGSRLAVHAPHGISGIVNGRTNL